MNTTEKAAALASFIDLVASVSTQLGTGWVQDWTQDPTDPIRKIVQVAEPHANLLLCRRNGRIEISGSWDGVYYADRPNTTRHAITVAESTAPELIARHIARRLLPRYLPAFAEAVQNRKAREAQAAVTTAALQTVATALGSEILNPGQHYERIRTKPDLTIYSVSGDQVRIDSFPCTPAQAIEIAKILQVVPRG